MPVGNFSHETSKFCRARKILVLETSTVTRYIKSNDRRNFCYDGNMEKVDISELFGESRSDVSASPKVIYFAF